MKKAVIFDMDGVLVQSEKAYLDRRLAFFAQINKTPGSLDIQDYIGASDQKIWEILIPDDFSERDRLKQQYHNYREQHQLDFNKLLTTGVEMVFSALQQKNIRIAIASASNRREIEYMLKRCKLDDYVTQVISGEECSANKPDPDIYLQSLQKLHLSANEAVAVEDSVLGIQAAKAAGIYTGALQPPKYYTIDQSAADFKIKDLPELLTYL